MTFPLESLTTEICCVLNENTNTGRSSRTLANTSYNTVREVLNNNWITSRFLRSKTLPENTTPGFN